MRRMSGFQRVTHESRTLDGEAFCSVPFNHNGYYTSRRIPSPIVTTIRRARSGNTSSLAATKATDSATALESLCIITRQKTRIRGRELCSRKDRGRWCPRPRFRRSKLESLPEPIDSSPARSWFF